VPLASGLQQAFLAAVPTRAFLLMQLYCERGVRPSCVRAGQTGFAGSSGPIILPAVPEQARGLEETPGASRSF